jgi:hypothetical protein
MENLATIYRLLVLRTKIIISERCQLAMRGIYCVIRIERRKLRVMRKVRLESTEMNSMKSMRDGHIPSPNALQTPYKLNFVLNKDR